MALEVLGTSRIALGASSRNGGILLLSDHDLVPGTDLMRLSETP